MASALSLKGRLMHKLEKKDIEGLMRAVTPPPPPPPREPTPEPKPATAEPDPVGEGKLCSARSSFSCYSRCFCAISTTKYFSCWITTIPVPSVGLCVRRVSSALTSTTRYNVMLLSLDYYAIHTKYIPVRFAYNIYSWSWLLCAAFM